MNKKNTRRFFCLCVFFIKKKEKREIIKKEALTRLIMIRQ